MTFRIIGHKAGIAGEAYKYMLAGGHTPARTISADVLIFCSGHSWQECVLDLIAEIRKGKAQSYVIVTSEHGAIPDEDDYMEYAAMKAAQKMVCQVLAHNGTPCVDISPAFVIDSGRNKKINLDEVYRTRIRLACRGKFPVRSIDVARAIVYAAENVNQITGTTIRVSAGWRM